MFDKSMRKPLLIGGVIVSVIMVGCQPNLSHNHPNTIPVWEIRESEEAEQYESEKEAEIAIETAKNKVALTSSYDAVAPSFTTGYIIATEPTEVPTTTTVEETTIATTEEPTEAPTTMETVAPTVAPTVAQTVAVQGYTTDEILLMRIASCEAYSQGAIGQALVMRVILNRCAISNVSVESVIYAPRQFSAVNTALFASGYISADAYQAIELIRQGWDASNGALYFVAARAYNPNGWFGTLQMLFQYGDHIFFK